MVASVFEPIYTLSKRFVEACEAGEHRGATLKALELGLGAYKRRDYKELDRLCNVLGVESFWKDRI